MHTDALAAAPYEQSSEILKAMAHPERLRLLAALRGGDQCVCHLTALLGKRQPYVSQQLAYLREAGLVIDFKDGLNVHYRIVDPRVFALLDTAAELIGHTNVFREAGISPRILAECTCPRCTARSSPGIAVKGARWSISKPQ